MNNNTTLTDDNSIARVGLPLKITGIVFWGLVIVGLLMTALLLPNLERQTAERMTMNAERFAYQMELYLTATPNAVTRQVEARLTLLSGMLGMRGAELHLQGRTIAVGTPGADDAVTTTDAAIRREGRHVARQRCIEIVYAAPRSDAGPRA